MKGLQRPIAEAFRELDAQECRLLESGLIDAAHRTGLTGRELESIDRSPLESTWYRIEIVTATFDSGEDLKFFIKDFGSYKRAKGRMAERRERERFFYKEVFPNGEIGLPRFVVDIWSDQRAWLTLEFVDGAPLAWHELEIWYEAAAWLGRWQTVIVDRVPSLRGSGHFLDRGRAHFETIARNATAGAARVGDDVVPNVEAAVPAYLKGAEQLIRHPQTLVHGAFRPHQILVNSEQAPVRICPTDWEIAAIGSCLYDLAALTDGFDGPSLETFLARFLGEAAWLRDDPPDLPDLKHAIKTCSTHRTLKWIAQGEKRGFSPDKVRELAASLAEPENELQP